MNRTAEVWDIYHRKIKKQEKIKLLEDLALDFHNELEAQDQNMHPEIYTGLSEGLQLVTNLLRELHDQTS